MPRPVRLPLGRDDEVAAGVHEVQNALTSVLGWLDVARGTTDSAVRDKALEVIARGVQRTRSLLATLADPGARFAVQPMPVRLGPLVAETYELLHPRCTAAGVALHLDAPPHDLAVYADSDRVVQIATNLVLNALDAILAVPVRTDGRGRIDVRITADERYVRLVVRDDGTGMDAQTVARAFEPFFTTHPEARGARRAGTGLGLAICRGLAEAMLGRMEIHSVPGHGTEVSLVLLREGVLSDLPPPPSEETVLPPGVRVLVVDDEPAIRELLEVALALRGAEVTVAASITEAQSALAHAGYDVVLVDETLGAHQSGAVLLEAIERRSPTVAHVLMTGAPSVEHLPPSVSRWLLRKPFSLDEVVKVLVRAMRERADERALK